MLAAKESKQVDRIFVSTDCPDITTIARDQSGEVIDRPPDLANKEAVGEDVFAHGYYEIKKRLNKIKKRVNKIKNDLTKIKNE